jgi:plastocyanin
MSALKTIYRKVLGSRSAGVRLLLPLLGLTVACGVALSANTNRGREIHDIQLTARDMAFYLQGDATPNPTLVVGRGETVRLTFTNEDRGMEHDFAVESLDVATRKLRGGADSVTFEAPGEPGESEYVCTLHARMMKGTLKVE